MTSPSARVSDSVEMVVPDADLRDGSMIRDFSHGTRLVGTRCIDCGGSALGERSVCSTCVSRNVQVIPLATTGKLYSFTVLHVGNGGESRPLGYVDLDDGVRVLSTLRAGSHALRPEVRVELASDGDEWWFAVMPAAVENER